METPNREAFEKVQVSPPFQSKILAFARIEFEKYRTDDSYIFATNLRDFKKRKNEMLEYAYERTLDRIRDVIGSSCDAEKYVARPKLEPIRWYDLFIRL